MSVIRATVTDQVLKITEAPLVASGGQNEVKVTFTFCEKWEGFAKTAIFYRDEDNVYHMVLDENNTCTVPWEVYYESGTFYFGVFGDKDDVRRTSSTARYRVKKGAVTDETMPSDPTPEVYDQIMSKLGEMEQNGADGKSIFYCNLNASGEEWTTDLSTINIGDSRIKIGDMFITANGLLYEVTVIVAGIVIGKLLAVNGDHAEGGPVTDEQIESAVERYLEENPVEVPETLPNPHKLTFTGAVQAEYDGSKEVTVEIPKGGNGSGIEVTGAEVGQTIVVKAVDENGKPTEWECADLPSDEEWERIAYGTLEADGSIYIDKDIDGNPFDLKKAVFITVGGFSVANSARIYPNQPKYGIEATTKKANTMIIMVAEKGRPLLVESREWGTMFFNYRNVWLGDNGDGVEAINVFNENITHVGIRPWNASAIPLAGTNYALYGVRA